MPLCMQMKGLRRNDAAMKYQRRYYALFMLFDLFYKIGFWLCAY